MTTSHWAIAVALTLALVGALYVRLGWRRSPRAYGATVGLAVGFFIAGALASAWALDPSSKHIAPPNCPNDPEPVPPARSENSACEVPYGDWATRHVIECGEARKVDQEKLADYYNELEQWNRREDARDRCRGQTEEQREKARFAALPLCPDAKNYIGKAYDMVAGWDMAVIARVAGNGADSMNPKLICRLTKAQENRIRAVWVAECEHEPDRVLHTESIGLGCWKIVDQCGEKRGTVCAEY